MSVRAVVDQQTFKSPTNALLSRLRDCILVVSGAVAVSLLAQGAANAAIEIESRAKPPASTASAANKGVLPIVSGPNWQELTPVQKDALKPLATQWNGLDDARKRKWIAIAANYVTLPPEGQAKLHSRMTEWVSLSQQQRAQARLNFAESKQLSPTQKAATWEAYLALSPEERQKLALAAPPKPTSAAPAAKPVPPQKLTAVPVTRKSPPPTLPASATVPAKTLIPPPPALESASVPIH